METQTVIRVVERNIGVSQIEMAGDLGFAEGSFTRLSGAADNDDPLVIQPGYDGVKKVSPDQIHGGMPSVTLQNCKVILQGH